jgi:hypothetical protein
VVLLQGDDLVADARYGKAGDTVSCRLATATLTQMNAGGGFVVPASLIPALPAAASGDRRDELSAIFAEAFFVDSARASLLANLVAAQGGDGNPAKAGFASFTAAVATAQRNLFSASPVPCPVTFTGAAPAALGVSAWTPPWIPVLLQWKVVYQPVLPVGSEGAAVYPEGFITGNYMLDPEDIELSYRHDPPSKLSSSESYSGTIVLGRNADLNLKAQIASYLANFPDPGGELKAVADHLPIAAMSQSLSGFNEALLMRRQTLQLPVADPLAIKTDSFMRAQFLNNDVASAIADANDTAPVPLGSYNPLRGGWMNLMALRVIDAFGQTRDVTDIRVVRASRFVPAGDKPSTAPPVIALPPRLTQPARLQFRWMSAEHDLVETNSHPATTPVCGWVLFNHLDGALMIYDAAGIALGSLNKRGPFWQGAPGNPDTFDKPVEAVFDASRNRHLSKFVLDICHRSAPVAFLTDLLAAIDRTVTNINPPGFKQDQALSVLIGRPLALVRASLDLDLLGLPAVNQSWDAFGRTARALDPSLRDSAAFERVDIPVRLGDLGRIDDGLIGYFIESGESTYGTFYAHAATTSANGVIAPAFDQLLVQADPAAPPKWLTMLVDPSAPVHATTGLLPVKSIELPADMYSGALNRMSVTFLAAPVLSGSAAFSVPVPIEQGYQWSWVSRDADAWSTLDRIPPVNPRVTFIDPGKRISEGWLRLSKKQGTPVSNSTPRDSARRKV